MPTRLPDDSRTSARRVRVNTIDGRSVVLVGAGGTAAVIAYWLGLLSKCGFATLLNPSGSGPGLPGPGAAHKRASAVHCAR